MIPLVPVVGSELVQVTDTSEELFTIEPEPQPSAKPKVQWLIDGAVPDVI